ncbi:MAG: type II toxin-antitoxin system PemK/MazF family toxin [Candidatus Gracilibacteria bacterium]|nr:type II toxin-antitoxin system PemK/MazF family toxin [Candidatus Gracilibacteria bacterium]
METEIFDKWNDLKKEIDLKNKNIYPKHREIWYISLGKNIGFESNGKGEEFKRPVLVINRIGTIYLIVSMTTKGKDSEFYYKLDESYFNKISFITLSQFKTIDKKRFIKKIGKINEVDFLEIKKRIKHLF